MNLKTISTGMMSLVFVAALSFVSVGNASAATPAPSLLSRVNEALMAAGIPVTAASQQSFAAGVANGHYTSYEQLVNAMKWHKAHGRTMAWWPVQAPKTWAFKGTVTDVTWNRIEMMGTNANGIEVWPKFKITKNTWIKNGVLLINASDEMRYDVKNEIRRGSVVTVWATSSGVALVIQNMAPWGQGDFYGPVDCPSCEGSTN